MTSEYFSSIGAETEKIRTESAPDITPKQQAFVDHYVTDFNATNAAKKAGYSKRSAARRGVEVRNKPQVDEAINSRMIELSKAVSKSQVISPSRLA